MLTRVSEPLLHQRGLELQRFNELRTMPLGLTAKVRSEVAKRLNKVRHPHPS